MIIDLPLVGGGTDQCTNHKQILSSGLFSVNKALFVLICVRAKPTLTASMF